MDYRLQAGLLGQMIERLPQGLRQHTNEDMGLHAATVLMPHRAKTEMALENPKGVLDDGQLRVRFPELLGGPAALIATQQVDTVARQGGLELVDVPADVQTDTSFLGDVQRDEGIGSCACNKSSSVR
jgi:hypothetical protein